MGENGGHMSRQVNVWDTCSCSDGCAPPNLRVGFVLRMPVEGIRGGRADTVLAPYWAGGTQGGRGGIEVVKISTSVHMRHTHEPAPVANEWAHEAHSRTSPYGIRVCTRGTFKDVAPVANG